MKLRAMSMGILVSICVFGSAFAQNESTKAKRPASKLAEASKVSTQRSDEAEEQIWKILKAGEKKINLCTTKYLKANPNQMGKLEVSFVIGSSGSVQKQSVTSKLRRRAYLHQCMIRAIRSWEFPKLDSTHVKMSFSVDVIKDRPFKFNRPKPKAKQGKKRRRK